MIKKVLFICTANIDRSPTAENLLKQKDGFEVKSAGTWQHARKRVTEHLAGWADIIFVMERYHKEVLLKHNLASEDKIIVLDIPDMYFRNNLELIRILKEKLTEHLHVNW